MEFSIFVCEDLRSKIKYQHDDLFVVAKAARGLQAYNKVYLNANRLTIDGTSYAGDNMKNLPDHINPCYISQRSLENIVCFGGRRSRFNPLSNFYEASL